MNDIFVYQGWLYGGLCSKVEDVLRQAVVMSGVKLVSIEKTGVFKKRLYFEVNGPEHAIHEFEDLLKSVAK